MKIETLEQVTVIGSGTMGHGIAQVCAQAGFAVVLYDVAAEPLEAGRARIATNLDKGIARGKVSASARDAAMSRLRLETDLAQAVAGSGLVIEAVPERMDLKVSIFRALVEHSAPDAALATNTSSLSVSAIGEACGAPERVIGLHFFNPVHIMKLLEVVRGEKTEGVLVREAELLAERLGKTAIVVRDVPGFATSRLGIALAMEAIRMLEQGVASAEAIDTAMELGYRHPMGPLRLTDLVGLDVRLDIARYLFNELESEVFRPPQLLEELVAAGKLGKKSGQGFYVYER